MKKLTDKYFSLLAALGMSLFCALTIESHFLEFWKLSLFLRVLAVCFGALVIMPLFRTLLRAAWSQLFPLKNWARYLWLVLAILAGFFIGQLMLSFISLPNIGQSRLLPVVQSANWVTSITLLPLLLFVTPFYSQRSVTTLQSKWKSIDEAKRVYYDKLFVALFVIILMLPMIGFQNLEEFDKTFWPREKLLRTFANTRYHILGDHIFKNMMVGENDWLIYTGELSLDDYQNTIPFSQEELALIQTRLDQLEARLNEKGIKFLVVVPPNKNTIYPEYFPPQIPVLGKESRYDQIVNYQKQHGHVQILDLRPTLMEARKEREVYYATDTHWNPYGAFLAYREIIKGLQKDFPNLQPHPLEDFQYISTGLWNGDLGERLGQISVEEGAYKLSPTFEPRYTVETDKTSTEYNVLVSDHPDKTLPRLVMYRDSFASSLYPLLANHFSRAVFRWTFQIDEVMIEKEKPDIVIFECTERYLLVLLRLPE